MSDILLSVLLAITLILSYLERRDLNNRLMSRDFSDYKKNTQKDEPNKIEEEVDDTIPIEQAYEQIEKDLING